MVTVKVKQIPQGKIVSSITGNIIDANFKRKTIEEHIRDGTYRAHKHGPKPIIKLLDKPALLLPSKKIDRITKKMIRSSADELAVEEGCRFDERYPQYYADSFHKYLRHSKGQWSNKPFDLLDWQANDIVWPLFGWIKPNGYRRYRWVYVEIPKKNGKSTLASALGIAFLIFDEEPGAEIYSCAADKEQSSIVHGEAINMLEASEELMRRVSINRSNKTVIYKQMKAYYKALSRSIEGKEGYNIHAAICDEVHVWKGREVWDALRYGFIARDQPCCFSITTAGEDMQSVCREQHDYAEGINSGLIKDSSFMGVIYAAEESKWREEEEWFKANPSLGHTINIDEFRSSFKQLAVKPSEEPNFKRRRLNIWCTSTKVWIDSANWLANAVDINEKDCLGGKFCCIGGDLAKTKDCSAIVLAFDNYDEKDNWYLKPFIFLPEERVKELDHLITGLNQWVKKGDLILTSGNVCDYDFIIDHVCSWVDDNAVNVSAFVFDPYNAEQFSQDISNRFNCERFAFGQTIQNYAEPTEEFERLVMLQKMHHGNNQMMNWQFSHCLTATDNGGRYKPVRYKKEDIRTIDSCVSSIMAMAKAMQCRETFFDGGGVYQ
jgi:phage terminase large subunit-like protein